MEWIDPLGLERIKSPKTIRYSQNGYSPNFGNGKMLMVWHIDYKLIHLMPQKLILLD